MKNLELTQMENVNGGLDGGDIMCGFAIASFGVSAAALFSTGVGAPVAYAAIGYALATPALTGCFL
ncbi:hypothetical protein ACFQ0R_04555 [Psychroflexus salinarum]|uniref:Bacteriocin-type signal sequence-containing protein n=1 Tax=Psychroflexus salinarum TaxID=546024 RepID=A0ABW3GMM9_9FLAO